MTLTEAVAVSLPKGRGYSVNFRPLSSLPVQLESVGLAPQTCLIITDENVAALYLETVTRRLAIGGWAPQTHVLTPGEETKSAESLSRVYDWALGLQIDRGTPVVALGGGVVGDLAGFAAATLLRGVPLIQLPTTVIAQVDSAIGGKTGINHALGKNLIGSFYQPRLVLTDTETLKTLSIRDYSSGLAEVVKTALVADAGLVSWLENEWEAVTRRDPKAVHTFVQRSAGVKAAIVSADEQESVQAGSRAPQRAWLNFGHTFGHAIERAYAYGTFTHGEAVALGMKAALHLSASVAAGKVATRLPNPFARAAQLVQRVTVRAPEKEVPVAELMDAVQTDKKRSGGGLQFVVLNEVGEASIASEVPAQFVEAAWRYTGLV